MFRLTVGVDRAFLFKISDTDKLLNLDATFLQFSSPPKICLRAALEFLCSSLCRHFFPFKFAKQIIYSCKKSCLDTVNQKKIEKKTISRNGDVSRDTTSGSSIDFEYEK